MIQQHTKNLKRSGISIIEVLTAIVVAMIGVFGVMVMIPFAVSQAQQGLDQERASSLALNAVSEFEIRNYINTQRWAGVDGAGNLVPLVGFSGRAYVIDPLGVAARANAIPPLGSGVFPFLHPTVEAAISGSGTYTFTPSSGGPTTDNGSNDQNILIDRVTISDEAVLGTGVFPATATGMSRQLAYHLFSWSSGLVFNEPTTSDIAGSTNYLDKELAPPKQVMDQLSDGSMGVRQSLKDMDYIVVALPSDVSASADYASTGVADRIISWRCYFVVYKNRPDPAPIGLAAPDYEGYDRIFEVTPPIDQVNANGAGLAVGPPADPQALSYRLSIAGGDLQMTEIIPGGVEYSSQQGEIRRGDWMMLTNVTFAHTDSTMNDPFRNRFMQQVNFYKVVDADFDGTSWNVSLQGPDFDFLYPIDPTPMVNFQPPTAGNPGCGVEIDVTATPPFQIRPSRTYAVHLPDVWTVFERTYR